MLLVSGDGDDDSKHILIIALAVGGAVLLVFMITVIQLLCKNRFDSIQFLLCN